jgi:hypothetical protein
VNLIASHGGLIDIDSNQSECPLMDTPVRAPKFAIHEPHIGIQKWELLARIGFGIGSRYHPIDKGKTDKAVEVRYGARLGIDWIATRQPGTKYVVLTAKARRATGNGNWSERRQRFCKSWLEHPRDERTTDNRSPGNRAAKLTPRYTERELASSGGVVIGSVELG